MTAHRKQLGSELHRLVDAYEVEYERRTGGPRLATDLARDDALERESRVGTEPQRGIDGAGPRANDRDDTRGAQHT